MNASRRTDWSAPQSSPSAAAWEAARFGLEDFHELHLRLQTLFFEVLFAEPIPDCDVLLSQTLQALQTCWGVQGVGFAQPDRAGEWRILAETSRRAISEQRPEIWSAVADSGQSRALSDTPAEGWGQWLLPWAFPWLPAATNIGRKTAEMLAASGVLIVSTRTPEVLSLPLLQASQQLLTPLFASWEQICLQQQQIVRSRQQTQVLIELGQAETVSAWLTELKRSLESVLPLSEVLLLVPEENSQRYWRLRAGQPMARLLNSWPFSLSRPPRVGSQPEWMTAAADSIWEMLSPNSPDEPRPVLPAAPLLVPLQAETATHQSANASPNSPAWLLLWPQFAGTRDTRASKLQEAAEFTAVLNLSWQCMRRKQCSRRRELATESQLPRQAGSDSSQRSSSGRVCLPSPRLRPQAEAVADVPLPVLISGPEGSGRTELACWLHAHSRGAKRACVILPARRCSAETLERWFEGQRAECPIDEVLSRRERLPGTLVLQEIEHLSSRCQASLLTALLQQEQAAATGGPLPPRLIVTSQLTAAALQSSETFLPDFASRLAVIQLQIPALAARPEEIVPLLQHFLSETLGPAADELSFSPAAEDMLRSFAWTGQLPQLRDLAEMLTEQLTEAERRAPINEFAVEGCLHRLVSPGESALPAGLAEATQEFQCRHIRQAIARAHGNMTEAARLLGLHRTNLYRKMRQLQMVEADQDQGTEPDPSRPA